MADLQISEFPPSLPADSDILHTKKANGEDNRTTVLALQQKILAQVTPYAPVEYPDLATGFTPVDEDLFKFYDNSTGEYSSLLFANLVRLMIDYTYPVGTVYKNYSNSANPSTYFLGVGTWTPIAGRCIYGVGESTDSGGTTRTFAPATTGGQHDVALAVNQLPSHFHKMFGEARGGTPTLMDETGEQTAAVSLANGAITQAYNIVRHGGSNGAQATIASTSSTGSAVKHENTPAHTTAYIWRRVA
jgi:hypothetical protein